MLVPYLKAALESHGPYLFPQAGGAMRTDQDNLSKRLRSAMGRAGFVEGYLHHCAAASAPAPLARRSNRTASVVAARAAE